MQRKAPADAAAARLGEIRSLLTGGDRRSIADSNRARAVIESNPSLVKELAALTADEDWLVTQRALDLLEKLAHEYPEWIEPHKKIFRDSLTIVAADKHFSVARFARNYWMCLQLN